MHATQSKRVLFKRSMIPKAGANSKPFTSEDWKGAYNNNAALMSWQGWDQNQLHSCTAVFI
jgi:hypothetical protein